VCYFHAGINPTSTFLVPSSISVVAQPRQLFHASLRLAILHLWVSRSCTAFDLGHSSRRRSKSGLHAKRVALRRTWPTPAGLESISPRYQPRVCQPSMGEPILRRGLSLPVCLLVLAGPPARRFSRQRQTWTAARTLRQLSTTGPRIPHSRRPCPLLRNPLNRSSPNMVAFQSQSPLRGISSHAAPLSATYITSNTVSLPFLYSLITNFGSFLKMFWHISNQFHLLSSRSAGPGGRAYTAYCFSRVLLPVN
jgi:hypothetical protein